MTRYYLGLDWGKSKIGVAAADEETRLAFGVGVLGNDTHLETSLRMLVDEYLVQEMVLGVPLHGQHQSAEMEVRAFGAWLERVFHVKVHLIAEMFTTKMAQANLRERGSRKIGIDDQESARILLQEWLDVNRS